MKALFKVWVKYALSGIIPGILEIIILYLLVEFSHLWYLLASTIALILSFSVSFYLRKFWVFRDYDKGKTKQQILLYALVVVFNIGVNIAIMYSLVELFNWSYLWAQVISWSFLGLASFAINKTIIFKERLGDHDLI